MATEIYSRIEKGFYAALFLLNYLVSRCLVSSECVAEAQYCCWFSFRFGLGNVWRNGNSTAQFGEIYTYTNELKALTHIHKLLWTGANKRKSENLLLHSNLNGLVFARERDEFFFLFQIFTCNIIASSLKPIRCFRMCVKCVFCAWVKRKWGRRRHYSTFISTICEAYSPHKSLIYMGIWLYFWVFKFKRCFVWNFVVVRSCFFFHFNLS